MAADDDNNNKTDGEPSKPPLGTRIAASLRSFGLFLFNPKDHTVMGRSAGSWAAILGFYIAFYAVLAAFWAACLATFMHTTIDFGQPTMQHLYSLLKDNPGMTYEPAPTSDNTIIAFNASDSSSYSAYVNRTNTIIQQYLNMSALVDAGDASVSNVKRCDPNDPTQQSNINYVCLYDVKKMMPPECLPENQFGFADGKPCIFLRANKIFNYIPTEYPTLTNLNATLDNPPPSLFSGPSAIVKGSRSIYVTCEGENPADTQNLLGVDFYPSQGLPFQFFPYLNQNNYLPPFVMARFKVIPGRVMMIWCRLWANGIKHDKIDLQGSIHFELMVDM